MKLSIDHMFFVVLLIQIQFLLIRADIAHVLVHLEEIRVSTEQLISIIQPTQFSRLCTQI